MTQRLLFCIYRRCTSSALPLDSYWCHAAWAEPSPPLNQHLASPQTKARRMVDRRPRSIADLAQEAHASIHFSTRYSCRAWLRSCAALRDQASSYRRTQEVGRERHDLNQEWEATEKEFVCWARCARYVFSLNPPSFGRADGVRPPGRGGPGAADPLPLPPPYLWYYSILLELLPTHPQFRDGLTTDEKATIRAVSP